MAPQRWQSDSTIKKKKQLEVPEELGQKEEIRTATSTSEEYFERLPKFDTWAVLYHEGIISY